MPTQATFPGNFNDGGLPFGARAVVFYRQSAPGSGVWSTKLGTYILEGTTPSRSARVIKRYDEVGQPNGSAGVEDYTEGSGTAQLATVPGDGSAGTTIPLRPGDAFATIFDKSAPSQTNSSGGAESFVLTKTDQPEAQLDYKKQTLSFQKLYTATISLS